MTIEGIIGALIIGLIIGALGRLVLPGKQDIPIWLTIVVGIVAALIGSLIVGSLRDTDGIDWIELRRPGRARRGRRRTRRRHAWSTYDQPHLNQWRRRGDLNSRWG